MVARCALQGRVQYRKPHGVCIPQAQDESSGSLHTFVPSDQAAPARLNCIRARTLLRTAAACAPSTVAPATAQLFSLIARLIRGLVQAPSAVLAAAVLGWCMETPSASFPGGVKMPTLYGDNDDRALHACLAKLICDMPGA